MPSRTVNLAALGAPTAIAPWLPSRLPIATAAPKLSGPGVAAGSLAGAIAAHRPRGR